ncbi:hypothetical protein pipiens_016068 [Culex pipiens pipiens]|uniref:Uncharacterized protein n=1 Tax=Culex pipiens pipiens TaxID=38569 RepID=A0ABD1CMY3_CULPP
MNLLCPSMDQLYRLALSLFRWCGFVPFGLDGSSLRVQSQTHHGGNPFTFKWIILVVCICLVDVFLTGVVTYMFIFMPFSTDLPDSPK